MTGVVILVSTVAYTTRVANERLQESIDDRQCEHALIADRQDVVAQITEVGIVIIIELHDRDPSPETLERVAVAKRQMADLRMKLDAINVECDQQVHGG